MTLMLFISIAHSHCYCFFGPSYHCKMDYQYLKWLCLNVLMCLCRQWSCLQVYIYHFVLNADCKEDTLTLECYCLKIGLNVPRHMSNSCLFTRSIWASNDCYVVTETLFLKFLHPIFQVIEMSSQFSLNIELLHQLCVYFFLQTVLLVLCQILPYIHIKLVAMKSRFNMIIFLMLHQGRFSNLQDLSSCTMKFI